MTVIFSSQISSSDCLPFMICCFGVYAVELLPARSISHKAEQRFPIMILPVVNKRQFSQAASARKAEALPQLPRQAQETHLQEGSSAMAPHRQKAASSLLVRKEAATQTEVTGKNAAVQVSGCSECHQLVPLSCYWTPLKRAWPHPPDTYPSGICKHL